MGHPPTAELDPWAAVAASFAALGRVVLLLDPEYHVVRASPDLDQLVCEGTAERILGKPVSAMLGSRLFLPGDELHRALSAGSRVEGRRAFIKCPRTGAQLVSVSAAPLPYPAAMALHPRARFMVVVRPADELVDPRQTAPVHGLMARSPAMLRVVSFIEALADSEANVLITGETGTGKGAVASAIHAHSPRRAGPFVTVDTGAIPHELLESELFGHVRGAFTGAHRDRVGQIELARGGTLFLDEIGDMPLPLQGKLLRLVEEREFRRLGESASRSMDARIIAATHVDLPAAIAAGRFREDLYYRLCVVPLELPPLRERPEEIPPLAHHLLARLSATTGRLLILAEDALAALTRYPWPGNVRQLENALEYAVAMCRGQTLHAEDLPGEVRTLSRANLPICELTPTPTPYRSAPPPSAEPSGPHSRELEGGGPTGPAAALRGRPTVPMPTPTPTPTPPPTPTPGDELDRIRQALEAHRWNRGAAAQALGMSRTTLWRKLRAYGLD